MASLVASLGPGKGTWTEVRNLMAQESWEKVYLVTNDFGRQNFQADAEFIVVDDRLPAKELVPEIVMRLKGRIRGADAALSIVSGSGNVHMAILAALLKLGMGIRLVGLAEGRVEEL